MKQILFIFLLVAPIFSFGQKNKTLLVSSPDGTIIVTVEAGAKIEWSVKHKGQEIITPSAIGLQLMSGEVLGDEPKIISSKMEKLASSLHFFRASLILDMKCRRTFPF